MTRRLAGPLLILGWTLSASGPANAQDEAATAGEAQVREALRDVVRAYRSLNAYQDQGRLEIASTIRGRPQTAVWPLTTRLVRPNKLVMDAGAVRVVADGKTFSTRIDPSKKVMSEPCPPALRVNLLAEGPLGAMTLGGPYSAPARLLLSLLFEDDPWPSILRECRAARMLPAQVIDGKTYPVIHLEQTTGPGLRLLVDPETSLLAAIELAVTEAQVQARNRDAVAVETLAVSWRSGPISTEPPDDSVFAFELPEGFSKVRPILVPPENRPAAEPKAHPLVGKPAPEFAFQRIDPKDPAKTAPVNKLDLQGKVVLIDFWATWCGPCLKKLPDLDALMARYRDAADVAIIALNCEGRGDELPALRAKIDRTLQQAKVDLLRHAPGGMVGLDTRMAVAEAFQVEFLPTVVLIDKQGVIRQYQVGAGEMPVEQIAAEIDALRAGKTTNAPTAP